MSDDSLSDVGKEYILGVVEGFYGNPWTKDERFNLLKRMKEQNMNAYINPVCEKTSDSHAKYLTSVVLKEFDRDHISN